MLLSEGVMKAASARPDAEGIAYRDMRLTWSQWDERIKRTAGALAAVGIRRGDRVAVLDRNHIDCLDVLLAAGSLGASTVIINWRLTDPELDYILGDCRPRILFLGVEFAERATLLADSTPGIERVVMMDEEFEEWIADAEPRVHDPDVTDDDVVLVIYTSGTTGRPKGAEFSHAGINANSATSAAMGGMGESDRVLGSMPLFHIGGAGATLAGIYEGVPITLLREPRAEAITEAIEGGCTRAFLVPAVISTLLDAGERERQALASLKVVTYGGAPCPLPILEKAIEALPQTSIMQVYGMTELCGRVTTLSDAAHRDAGHRERLASAGEVIEGVEMRIVDPQTLADVPPGTPGELWFLTPKRMKGYLGLPEATSEVIVEGGWLRTGDIGRVDQDGFVYIEDRLKDMIISGGENIYCLEVEGALESHPDVAEAAVIGVPDPVMGESVVAVVVAGPGTTLDPDELIEHARQDLARYKCPRHVIVVEALPRNASGKVLKRELRAQAKATLEANT